MVGLILVAALLALLVVTAYLQRKISNLEKTVEENKKKIERRCLDNEEAIKRAVAADDKQKQLVQFYNKLPDWQMDIDRRVKGINDRLHGIDKTIKKMKK